MIQFIRILQTGCRNFMRNAWLSVAATAVMTLTLTIIVISFISNLALTSTIKGVTDKIDVSVFLKTDITQSEVDGFRNSLTSSSNVAAVEYITKEQALATFQEKNKANPDTLAALVQAGNTLPASFNIKAKNPKKLNEIADVINQPANKALLDPTAPQTYSGGRKTTIDRIVSFSNFFKTGGLILSVIFVVISTLIIFNTIQMAIFNRRDEITIMRLLGAKTNYIRGPFIVESAIYGILSAVISVLILNSAFLASSNALQATSLGLLDINYAQDYFGDHFWRLLTLQLMVGIVIGTASSIIATRRYLKFKTK